MTLSTIFKKISILFVHSELAKASADSGQTPSFWSFFQEWSERDDKSIRQRRLAYRNISRLMGTAENWDDIDSSYHYRLIRKMNEAKFALNYKWRTVQQLRTVMNEGLKLKYHHNDDFKYWKTRGKHQTPSTYPGRR